MTITEVCSAKRETGFACTGEDRNPGAELSIAEDLGCWSPHGMIWGGVELGLSPLAGFNSEFYGFSVNVYGFSTNAHTLDAQNAFERGLNATIPALAGADELSGIGEMEAGVMGSYAQMVLDNELVGSVMRLRKGLSADVEHLAVEIIGNVMDGTRNYLGQKHTLKHLRAGELALTKLAERNSWDTGGKFERKGWHLSTAEQKDCTEPRSPLDRNRKRMDRIRPR